MIFGSWSPYGIAFETGEDEELLSLENPDTDVITVEFTVE